MFLNAVDFFTADQVAQDILDPLKGWGVLDLEPGLQRAAGNLLPHFTERIVDGLSVEEKKLWEFHFPELSQKPDYGLVCREKGGNGDPRQDGKNFIHIRPWDVPDRRVPELLQSRDVDISTHVGFFEACNRVTEQVFELAKLLAERIDEKSQLGLLDAILTPKAMNQHVLRILCYDPSPHGGLIADPHIDFSCLTFCLYETHPGLWIKDPSNLWRFNLGRIPVFPGRKMPPFSGGLINGMPHGANIRGGGRRCAVVAFFHVDGPMGPGI